MAETSQEKKGNVIKGPWKRKPKIPRNIVQEIEDDIAFIEDLTESMLVQIIYTIGENGIDINSKTFLRDIGFVIEGLKSALCRQYDIGHPLSEFIETISETTIEEIDGQETVTTVFRHERLEKIMENMKRGNKDKPDIS